MKHDTSCQVAGRPQPSNFAGGQQQQRLGQAGPPLLASNAQLEAQAVDTKAAKRAHFWPTCSVAVVIPWRESFYRSLTWLGWLHAPGCLKLEGS